jgi:biopolymer transport protein ExbB
MVQIRIVWLVVAACSLAGFGLAQTGTPVAADSGSIAAGRSLEELFTRGGPLMWPILLCSIVMVAFVFERLVALRRKQVFPAELRADMQRLANEGRLDVDSALLRCAADGSPFARLLHGCLLRASADGFEMEAGLEDAGARVLHDLRNNGKALSVIADIAPLLGLMGTVTGMIKAFDVVAKSNALGRTGLLAGGISEALLTTAFGLLVAVPAIIAYHIFRSRADNLVREMEDACLEIVVALRRVRPERQPV